MFDVFTGGDVRVLLSCHLDLCVDILKVKVTQSCQTLCDPVDNTVYGILQARILEWVALPFSRGAPQPRDWTRVFCIAGRFFQFSSVQSRPTLCDPMDCSTPGLPVLHYHPDSCPSSQWCHPTISSSVVPFSSRLQSFPGSASFQMSQFFASGGERIGASASAAVLPMNIQDWFPLGRTGWISLQSKGLSRCFYYVSSSFFYGPLSHSFAHYHLSLLSQ